MATNNIINTTFPLTIPDGGTGITAFTNTYAPLRADTTGTAPIDDIGSGTTGQVLTSGGPSATSTWETVPTLVGEDYQVISSSSASGSATIDFNITGYSYYTIYISGLVAANDVETLQMLVSTDSGSTFKTGASDYRYSILRLINASDQAATSLGSDHINLNNLRSNVSTRYSAGIVNILGAAETTNTTIFYADQYINSNGTTSMVSSSGQYLATTTVDAVRFQMSSGNIATGEFKLYGIT